MKLEAHGFNLNGTMKGTVIARHDDDQPTGYEWLVNLSTERGKTTLINGLVEDLGQPEDKARAAVAALMRDLRATADTAATKPATSTAPLFVGDGAQLLDDIRTYIRRYVVLTNEQADAVALWVAHTYGLDACDTTPYLNITSAEKQSGKSRLLEVLENLVHRPWFTASVSGAVLARKVAAEHATVLLDELDAQFKADKETAELVRGILNAGYRRGGAYSRMVGQGAGLEVRDFDCFSPKALAGIGSLPSTVLDRCVIIRLQRRAASEPVEKFRRRYAKADAQPLQQSIEGWMAQQLPRLIGLEPDVPDGLSDRQADGWEPLLAIADVAGGDWPERARWAALGLSGADVREDESTGVRLLADMRAAFDAQGKDALPTTLVLSILNDIEESPWATWNNRKGMGSQDLARTLKPFGIKPRTIRVQTTTAKGYTREDFDDAFSRYLPSPLNFSVTPSHRGDEAAESVTPTSNMLRDVTGVPAHDEANVTGFREKVGGTADQTINDGCVVCGGEVWVYAPDGSGFCVTHQDGAEVGEL